MLKGFKNGEDIHKVTVSEVFGVAFQTDNTLAAMNGALLEQLLNWQQNRV